MTDHQILVHHFDIAGNRDVTGFDFSRTGRAELQPLGAFALHPQRDLLHVEHDVGHVFTHPASELNSCSTFSILIEVIAAPCSDDSSTRRSALPSVRPKPRIDDQPNLDWQP